MKIHINYIVFDVFRPQLPWMIIGRMSDHSHLDLCPPISNGIILDTNWTFVQIWRNCWWQFSWAVMFTRMGRTDGLTHKHVWTDGHTTQRRWWCSSHSYYQRRGEITVCCPHLCFFRSSIVITYQHSFGLFFDYASSDQLSSAMHHHIIVSLRHSVIMQNKTSIIIICLISWFTAFHYSAWTY